MKTSVKMVACFIFSISLLAVSCNNAENQNTVVQEKPLGDISTADDKFKFEVEYEDDYGGGIENPDNWKVTNGTPTDPNEIPSDPIEMSDIRIVSWNPTCIQIGSRVWCY